MDLDDLDSFQAAISISFVDLHKIFWDPHGSIMILRHSSSKVILMLPSVTNTSHSSVFLDTHSDVGPPEAMASSPSGSCEGTTSDEREKSSAKRPKVLT